MSPMRKSYIADYCKKRRDRLYADGMCIDCGNKPRIETAKRCAECNGCMLSRNAARYRERNQDARERAEATYEDIAAELGVSREMVRIIMARAIRKLRAACRKAGIDASDITGAPRSMLERAEDWA